LPLIRAYQEFYKVSDICDEKNKKFFSQFGVNNPFGCQFISRDGSDIVGFATVYFSFASTIISKVAVLSDRCTLPHMRGKGIGKNLIEHCREFAANSRAARLQWVTAPDNEQAQGLYDSLNANRSTWYFYAYDT